MAKTKKATATNPTVKKQLDRLMQTAHDLQADKDFLIKENKALKKQLAESNNMWEVEVKRDDIAKIKAMSDYTQNELENMKPEEITRLLSAMTRVKGATKSPYKPIRAAGDTKPKGNTTVGSLFGKTREEILAMGGEH